MRTKINLRKFVHRKERKINCLHCDFWHFADREVEKVPEFRDDIQDTTIKLTLIIFLLKFVLSSMKPSEPLKYRL